MISDIKEIQWNLKCDMSGSYHAFIPMISITYDIFDLWSSLFAWYVSLRTGNEIVLVREASLQEPAAPPLASPSPRPWLGTAVQLLTWSLPWICCSDICVIVTGRRLEVVDKLGSLAQLCCLCQWRAAANNDNNTGKNKLDSEVKFKFDSSSVASTQKWAV